MADVAQQYAALAAGGSDCIDCGDCVQRCRFGVEVPENMRRAAEVLG